MKIIREVYGTSANDLIVLRRHVYQELKDVVYQELKDVVNGKS
jgi:hypothetical protein